MYHRIPLFILAFSAFTPSSATEWTALGPDGGRVSALATAPSNRSVVYAGGANVFRSADSGLNWSAMASPFPTRGPEAMPARVTALAVCPTDANRVLAATPQGLFLSTDGATWKRAGTITAAIRAVAWGTGGGNALAAGPTSVYRSADRGVTWTSATAPSIAALCDDPTSATAFFAVLAAPDAQGRSLLRTTDGMSFTPLAVKNLSPRALCPAPDGAFLYAAVDGPDGGTFRIARDGSAAARLSSYPAVAVAAPAGFPGWVFSASDANHVFAAAYRTLDDGVSWKPLQIGFGACPIASFALGDDLMPLAGGDGSGVLACDALDVWTQRRAGLSMACVNGVAVDAQGKLLAAAADGLYRRGPASASWVFVRSASASSQMTTSPARAGRVYFTGPTALERSDDGGQTWRSLAAYGLPSGAKIARVVAHPSRADTVFAVLRTGAVFRSTGSVAHFYEVLPAFTAPPASPPDVALCPSDGDAAYAVREDGLYASADGGATWQRRAACPPDARIAADTDDASVLYRATSAGGTVTVSRSRNGGRDWSTLHQEAGLASGGFAATFLARDQRAPGRIVLGTNRGTRVSDDDGLSWRVEPTGYTVCWAPGDDGVDLVGTDGEGLLRGVPSVPTLPSDLTAAAEIMRLAMQTESTTPAQLAFGDRNGDGSITAADAGLTLRRAGGLM